MSKKILVVDDNDGVLAAFRAMLEFDNYEVETVSIWKPLDNVKKEDLPGLILLDVLLSGADGREICKELKKDKKTKHIPVVMISAHPSAEKGAYEAGADDFLSKPFEMDELMQLVVKYLK